MGTWVNSGPCALDRERGVGSRRSETEQLNFGWLRQSRADPDLWHNTATPGDLGLDSQLKGDPKNRKLTSMVVRNGTGTPSRVAGLNRYWRTAANAFSSNPLPTRTMSLPQVGTPSSLI